MAFSNETIRDTWKLAGGRCECQRAGHDHGARCPRRFLLSAHALLSSDAWVAVPWTGFDQGGPDAPENAEAVCWPCVEQGLRHATEAVRPEPCVEYEIDGADHLTRVGWQWRQFAAENNALELLPERVLGKSLWDFVSGQEALTIWRALARRVRMGIRLRFSLRCDAPLWRRDLRMALLPVRQAGVRFQTSILAITPRPSCPLLDVRTVRGPGSLPICDWCGSVLAPDGEWWDVEKWANFAAPLPARHPALEHSICPKCRLALLDLAA